MRLYISIAKHKMCVGEGREGGAVGPKNAMKLNYELQNQM